MRIYFPLSFSDTTAMRCPSPETRTSITPKSVLPPFARRPIIVVLPNAVNFTTAATPLAPIPPERAVAIKTDPSLETAIPSPSFSPASPTTCSFMIQEMLSSWYVTTLPDGEKTESPTKSFSPSSEKTMGGCRCKSAVVANLVCVTNVPFMFTSKVSTHR